MLWPSFSAPSWRPSAAMKVCAMPVGHEVIATMFAMVVSSFLSEKDKRNSSGTFLVPPAAAGEEQGKEARTPRAPAGGRSPPAPLLGCTTKMHYEEYRPGDRRSLVGSMPELSREQGGCDRHW